MTLLLSSRQSKRTDMNIHDLKYFLEHKKVPRVTLYHDSLFMVGTEIDSNIFYLVIFFYRNIVTEYICTGNNIASKKDYTLIADKQFYKCIIKGTDRAG